MTLLDDLNFPRLVADVCVGATLGTMVACGGRLLGYFDDVKSRPTLGQFIVGGAVTFLVVDYLFYGISRKN